MENWIRKTDSFPSLRCLFRIFLRILHFHLILFEFCLWQWSGCFEDSLILFCCDGVFLLLGSTSAKNYLEIQLIKNQLNPSVGFQLCIYVGVVSSPRNSFHFFQGSSTINLIFLLIIIFFTLVQLLVIYFKGISCFKHLIFSSHFFLTLLKTFAVTLVLFFLIPIFLPVNI